MRRIDNNTKNNDLPRHIAIIMDGNGRWAKKRGFPRIEGHRRGAGVARNIVKFSHKMGIEYLTFFAFSSENWSRPEKEVNYLMDMMRHYLKNDVKELEKYDARLHVIGNIDRLPEDIIVAINKWQERTKDNKTMHVVMALSYGGRQDIVEAVRSIIKEGIEPEDMNEAVFASHLMTKNIPEPDLLIRTSGEQRISNFLLWQLAYTEMYFTDVYWPDFNESEFEKAISSYRLRERRYGGIKDEYEEYLNEDKVIR